MDRLQEIDIYFNQLKELRNATITYAQMAKRDKNRPPVRPICRRLGVNKLSEIKSDGELYEAVCCYVYDELYDGNGGGGDYNDDNDNIISQRQPPSPLVVNPSLPSLSSSQHKYPMQPQMMTSHFSPSPSPAKSPHYLSNTHSWMNNSNNNSNNNINFSMLSNTSMHEPEMMIPEYRLLLDCVLAVRISCDRYNRLDIFARDFHIDQGFLLNALKSICGIIGCDRLSLDIDIGAVMFAVEKYYRSLPTPSASLSSHPYPVASPLHRHNSFNTTASSYLPSPVLPPSYSSRKTNEVNNNNYILPQVPLLSLQIAENQRLGNLNNNNSYPSPHSHSSPFVTTQSRPGTANRQQYNNNNNNDDSDIISVRAGSSASNIYNNNISSSKSNRNNNIIINSSSRSLGNSGETNMNNIFSNNYNNNSNSNSNYSTPYSSPRSYSNPPLPRSANTLPLPLPPPSFSRGVSADNYSLNLSASTSNSNNNININNNSLDNSGGCTNSLYSNSRFNAQNNSSFSQKSQNFSTPRGIEFTSQLFTPTPSFYTQKDSKEYAQQEQHKLDASQQQQQQQPPYQHEQAYEQHNDNDEDDKNDEALYGFNNLSLKNLQNNTSTSTSTNNNSTNNNFIQLSRTSPLVGIGTTGLGNISGVTGTSGSSGGNTLGPISPRRDSATTVLSGISMGVGSTAGNTNSNSSNRSVNGSISGQSSSNNSGTGSMFFNSFPNSGVSMGVHRLLRNGSSGTSSGDSGFTASSNNVCSDTSAAAVAVDESRDSFSSDFSSYSCDVTNYDHFTSLLPPSTSSPNQSSTLTSKQQQLRLDINTSMYTTVTSNTLSSSFSSATQYNNSSNSNSKSEKSSPAMSVSSRLSAISTSNTPVFFSNEKLVLTHLNEDNDEEDDDVDIDNNYDFSNNTSKDNIEVYNGYGDNSNNLTSNPLQTVFSEFWSKSYHLLQSVVAVTDKKNVSGIFDQLSSLNELVMTSIQQQVQKSTCLVEEEEVGDVLFTKNHVSLSTSWYNLLIAQRVVTRKTIQELCCKQLLLSVADADEIIHHNHNHSKNIMQTCAKMLEQQLLQLHSIIPLSQSKSNNVESGLYNQVSSSLTHDVTVLKDQLNFWGSGNDSVIDTSSRQESSGNSNNSISPPSKEWLEVMDKSFWEMKVDLILPTTAPISAAVTTTLLSAAESKSIADKNDGNLSTDIAAVNTTDTSKKNSWLKAAEKARTRLSSVLNRFFDKKHNRNHNHQQQHQDTQTTQSSNDHENSSRDSNSPSSSNANHTECKVSVFAYGAAKIGVGDFEIIDVDFCYTNNDSNNNLTSTSSPYPSTFLNQSRSLNLAAGSGVDIDTELLNAYEKQQRLWTEVHSILKVANDEVEEESDNMLSSLQHEMMHEKVQSAWTDCMTSYHSYTISTISHIKKQNNYSSSLSQNDINAELKGFQKDFQYLYNVANQIALATAIDLNKSFHSTATATTPASVYSSNNNTKNNNRNMRAYSIDDYEKSEKGCSAANNSSSSSSSSFMVYNRCRSRSDIFNQLLHLKFQLHQVNEIIDTYHKNFTRSVVKHLESIDGYEEVSVEEMCKLKLMNIFENDDDNNSEKKNADVDNGLQLNSTIDDMFLNNASNVISATNNHRQLIHFFDNKNESLSTQSISCYLNIHPQNHLSNHQTNIHSYYPLITSSIISFYYNHFDTTCKLKLFAAIVQRFVKENQLNSELSSYAWNVLILHFLLKFGYIINCHDNIVTTMRMDTNSSNSDDSGSVNANAIDKLASTLSSSTDPALLTTCHDKINSTSVFELLHSFFKYLSFELDVFDSIVTVRGNGKVRSKSKYLSLLSTSTSTSNRLMGSGGISNNNISQPQLCSWRLCIEDIVETAESSINFESPVNIVNCGNSNNNVTQSVNNITEIVMKPTIASGILTSLRSSPPIIQSQQIQQSNNMLYGNEVKNKNDDCDKFDGRGQENEKAFITSTTVMNDLGVLLTFTGQVEVFKTVRMAFYALCGMLTVPVSEVSEYGERFLVNGQLQSLAIAGGFSFHKDVGYGDNNNREMCDKIVNE